MSNPPVQQFTCAQCGHTYLAKSSSCQQCGGMSKSEGEYTRKTFDAPDLKKGLS